MDADWKAALAAMHRDVLHGDSPWRPLRQSVSVAETVDGRWWKLALAVLPVALFLGLLWRAAQPPLAPNTAAAPRFEVVFFPRQKTTTESVPPPPEPPVLRRQRSLIAVPVPASPSSAATPLPSFDDDAAYVLPPPSGGDLLRQLEHSASRSHGIDVERLSRHGRPRLPGRAEAFVDGIQVRGRASPEQRVQFVLGLIGLGRPNPCPDIRRHVRDAIAAKQAGQGIEGELDDWLTRAEHCRR
ncbi:MAG: hypothetical protein R3F22_02210 [Lysobacteraceae bacterium]